MSSCVGFFPGENLASNQNPGMGIGCKNGKKVEGENCMKNCGNFAATKTKGRNYVALAVQILYRLHDWRGMSKTSISGTNLTETTSEASE